MPTATALTLCADRKQLLAALTRISGVIPKRGMKPILEGVHLKADRGDLDVSATNLDISLVTRVLVDGDLPACVVHAGELIRRLKTGKADTCTLRFDEEDQTLVLNGGRVEHRIHTMDLAEFPPIEADPSGATWHAAGEELRNALAGLQSGCPAGLSRFLARALSVHLTRLSCYTGGRDGAGGRLRSVSGCGAHSEVHLVRSAGLGMSPAAAKVGEST